MTTDTVRIAGRVGVPRKGETICPDCNGSGSDPAVGYNPMGGCERCSATGVVALAQKGETK